MENLLKFIAEHGDEDVSKLILSRKKYPEVDMELAVNCIESRRKLKGKVQQWYENTHLIFPLKLSAEQCSSSATGQYKAELAESIISRCLDSRGSLDMTGEGSPDMTERTCHFELDEKSPQWTIADLTGGLGVDSWYFSQKATKVIYNEMQSVLCDAARHNFKVLGAENILVTNRTIEQGRCLDSLRSLDMTGEGSPDMTERTCHFEIDEKSPDIVYMDPARRGEGGRKVFLIEDCTPDVLTLKDEIFLQCRHILLKLSPMADITMACERLGRSCREVHVVATGGECKELLIWMDREWNDECTIIAAELHSDSPASLFVFTPSDEKSSPIPSSLHINNATYLFEPGKALMKAGAYNLIAARFGIEKLGRSTHYYVMDSEQKALSCKAYGKVFEILEQESLNKKSLKEFGKKYPKAEVSARNIPMDTDSLRKKMGITSGDDAHIFGLKSDTEGNLLIAARRI